MSLRRAAFTKVTTMKPWVIRCRDDAHAAAEAARVTLDARVRAGNAAFGLALSGGRIAPVFFGQLLAQAPGRGVSLADVDYFWADERCVPADHADSNYRVARSTLLEPAGVSAERVHRLRGEDVPAEGAAAAVADWESWRARRGGAREAMDVVVLGLGEDGHVASLFPGNVASDVPNSAPFFAVRGPKPPPDRITMSYGMLRSAGLVVVLVTGAGKEEVLARATRGDADIPLARVFAGREGRETVVVTPLAR